MFLSEFWMPCSQILLWFKNICTFSQVSLGFIAFFEAHVTAFGLKGTLELILGQPPHSIEETEAQKLVVDSEWSENSLPTPGPFL